MISSSATKIYCLGNRFRNDDGIALVIGRLLRFHLKASVVFLGQRPDKVLDFLEANEFSIIIDAAKCDGKNDFLHLNVLANGWPRKTKSPVRHGLDIGTAISNASSLGRQPAQVHLFAICANDFKFGRTISKPTKQNGLLTFAAVCKLYGSFC